MDTCVKIHENHVERWAAAKGIEGKDRYGHITVVITTYRLPQPIIKEEDERRLPLLMLDITEFDALYGVLTPLLQPVLTHRLDINAAHRDFLDAEFNDQRLVSGILAQRELGGFRDLEALQVWLAYGSLSSVRQAE